MDPLWKEYEYYVCIYHRDKYNQIVWHNDCIPEEHLDNAGIIHDYNKHRLKRLARKKELLNKKILYQDYGIDFLSLDQENNYHVGQAKHYTKKKVTGKDIGTFQLMVSLVKSQGYLYTTSDLEINLKETLLATNIIKHHRIPYNKINNNNSIINEIDIELYPYQIDAIKYIMENDDDDIYQNRKFLELFCGGGKTIIAGNYLRKTNYDLIICIAPLRISVEQLKNRISPFIPNHEILLVDSDSGGTTDIDFIQDKIKNTKKLVIFSTYKSTEELLIEIIKDYGKDTFILIDEVHNMITNIDLCNFANKFYNGLFLSATIPEEAYQVLNAYNCYSYNIGKAIKNKYICDYNVYLPYIENNIIDVDIPIILKNKNDDLSAKIMFLANGLLKTGSRRCIIYLANQEECDIFLEIAKIAFEGYHGLNYWGDKIDSSVSTKKRGEIIKEFQNDKNNDTIRIIASVRILDEAIDIPKCDSEFITVIGDKTSDIRTIQRLCRGCRIDKDNPNKKNNLFIWCNEWAKAINCLELLKDNDPEFHKKINSLNLNYDKNKDLIIKEKIKIQKEDLEKYININCLCLDERWEIKRQEWIKQYNIKCSFPSLGSKNIEEKKAAQWQSDMRKYYKKGKLSQERIDILNNTIDWKWSNIYIESFNDKLLKWIKQYNIKGNRPSRSSEDENEKKSAEWQNRLRTEYKNKLLSQDKIDILNNTVGWKWLEPDYFDENLEKWIEEYNIKGSNPSKSAKNTEEKKAGTWQGNIRNNYKKGILSQDKIDILNNISIWSWSNEDTFDDNLKYWIEQHNIKKTSSKWIEKKAGGWQNYIRDTYKKGKLSQERIDILNNIEGWKWLEEDPFNKNLEEWIKQYNIKGSNPSRKSKKIEEKK